MCGETPLEPLTGGPPQGRSPRVRGNRLSTIWCLSTSGSIPACAGKPGHPARADHRRQVDPRVCGETEHALWREGARYGRSPRVRGNQCLQRQECRQKGSIPACAGKPPRPTPAADQSRVDPRVCGETMPATWDETRDEGRSPRVRGNLSSSTSARLSGGSIPACAGKPQLEYVDAQVIGVDPRVCGETQQTPILPPGHAGRSPRVRGNRGWRTWSIWSDRSIPACAGKPAAPAARA